MASQIVPKPLTFDEYLEIDSKAEFKSEYRAGEIFAMSGGTDKHALLAAELIYLFRSQNSRECRAYTSDLRLYVPCVNEGMYPDVTVICGQPEYHNDRRDVVLNPSFLVEVLSPSSADYDKGLKAEFYRQIASLHVLLLVDSQKRYVQTQTRQPDGSWKLEEFSQPEQIIRLKDWTFSLAEIYSNILEG